MTEAIRLPADLQNLVDQELATGKYESAEDVLKTAVNLMREQAESAEAFRAQIQSRISRLEQGEAIELNVENGLSEFFDDIRNRGRIRRELLSTPTL